MASRAVTRQLARRKVSFGPEAVQACYWMADRAAWWERLLRAGLAAVKAGKVLAYANKESLVAGDLLMPGQTWSAHPC